MTIKPIAVMRPTEKLDRPREPAHRLEEIADQLGVQEHSLRCLARYYGAMPFWRMAGSSKNANGKRKLYKLSEVKAWYKEALQKQVEKKDKS